MSALLHAVLDCCPWGRSGDDAGQAEEERVKLMWDRIGDGDVDVR
jgi:hypothetical protein